MQWLVKDLTLVHDRARICTRAWFRSVQSLSHVQLCNPVDYSAPGFPVHHQLWEFAQAFLCIESVMPSSYLVLCRLLLLRQAWRTPKIMLLWTTLDCLPKSLAIGLMKETRRRVASKRMLSFQGWVMGRAVDRSQIQEFLLLGIWEFRRKLRAYCDHSLRLKYMNQPKQ